MSRYLTYLILLRCNKQKQYHYGYSRIILRDNHFNLVSIKFDTESNKAAIEKVDDLGRSLVNASTKVKHAVIDRLIEINKRRG